MTTILIKKKDTAGAPAPGDLTNAAGGTEIAVNTATKRIYTKDSGGNVVELGTNPSTIDTTTVDTTNLEVTNIKAKDGTASATIADSTGVMTIGSSVLTTTDINGGTIDNTVIGGSTPAAGTFTSLSDSGNLTFTGTGNRITGDFSNATIASRVLLQSSTTNGQSSLGLLPNGTSTQTQYIAFNSTDPANSSYIQTLISATEGRINSGQLGTGTNLPMTFYTGGSERVRIDTSGNVGIGTSSPSGKLSLVSQTVDATTFHILQNRNNGGSTPVIDVIDDRGFGGVNSGAVARFRAWSTGDDTGSLIEAYTTGDGFVTTNPVLYAKLNGNVGIGTSSPSKKLDILDSAATSTTPFANQIFQLRSNGSGADATIQFTDSVTYNSYFGSGGGNFYWNTTGTERMRIDSSGNVGIGTSSPVYPLQIVGSLGIVATNQFTDDAFGGGFITAKSRGTTTSPTTVLNNDSLGLFSAGGYNSASIVYNRAALQMYAAENWTTTANGSYLTLATTSTGATARTERMRIDSSGNLLVGTTAVSNSCKQTLQFTTGSNGLCILTPDNISGTDFAIFRANGAGCGAISRVGTTSAVVYTATSDYRLKTVVGAVTGQGERIDALQPIEYTWNSNGLRTRGFLAHRFQEVYAGSVTGSKDAVDAEGKPVYQQMQASSSEVIADLVAEIQSLRKRLTALESK